MSQPPKTIKKPKKWHSLTEIPESHEIPSAHTAEVNKVDANNKDISHQARHPLLSGLSIVLIKLLWDIMVYPFSSVSVRIKRIDTSARKCVNAEQEGCEKGLIFESFAGATKYLIPNPVTFEAFGMPCPYKRDVSAEHSYYVQCSRFLLSKDPNYKSVLTEVKCGSSSSTSDVITVAHNGTRRAWEVTLNTTNVLANAAKYDNTNFERIVFLCRDYKLREAVKACCREGGLNPDLLAKLDYMQFSTLLRRQRKMSLY
ncbi:hypothetical protein ACFL5F_08030 [Planctomycetota bacterium]